MSVEVISQEASQARRGNARFRCVATACAVDPRLQREQALRRITVMRRLCRPANPRVITVAAPLLASCLVPSTPRSKEEMSDK